MKRAFIALAPAVAALALGIATPAVAGQTPDKSRIVTTDDGWQLRVTKAAETIDRDPGLTASPLSHEGFVSLTAIADITGHGHVPVKAGTLTVGYQIGCQADVSNGLSLGISAAVGPEVAVTIIPTPGVMVGGEALALPSASVTLKSGTVTTIPFATKTLAGPHGSITTSQVEIKIDSCLGRASIRSYAIVSMSTDTADNSVAVYGDPIWL